MTWILASDWLIHTVDTVPSVTGGLIKQVVDVDLIWILDLDQRAHPGRVTPASVSRGLMVLTSSAHTQSPGPSLSDEHVMWSAVTSHYSLLKLSTVIKVTFIMTRNARCHRSMVKYYFHGS